MDSASEKKNQETHKVMGKYITMTVKSQGTDGELTQGFNAKARCTPERDTG